MKYNYENQETALQAELLAVQLEIRKKRVLGYKPHPIWGSGFICSKSAPWISISPTLDRPCMLSHEDAQYLSWIAGLVPENSDVLELGPWLGMSTALLARNLRNMKSFSTVDDFVWRSAWMDDYFKTDQLKNGSSFLSTFVHFNEDILDKVNVVEAAIERTADNSHLPSFLPSDTRYSLVLVDCGRTFRLNETWWSLLRNHMIPRETLIILQDFGTHKEVPFKWYNQIKLFVDSKTDSLQQIHEVSTGGIASFVYNGG